MKYLLLLAVFAVLISPIACNQIERERETAVQSAKAVVTGVIDKAKIDASSMSARGEVHNPEYQFSFFAGTGVYVNGSVRAIGVQVEADIQGSGVGSQQIDPDLRTKINDILTRDDLARDQRKLLVTEAVTGWLRSLYTKNGVTVPPDPVVSKQADALADQLITGAEAIPIVPPDSQPSDQSE